MPSSLSASKGRGKDRCAPRKSMGIAGCAINVRFGAAGPSRRLVVEKLDEVALADVVEQARNKKLADKPLALEVDGLTEWPADARDTLWRLWCDLGQEGRRPVKLIADRHEYDRPLDFAAASLHGSLSRPEETCTALDLVAEVLLRCHRPEDRVIHLDAVVARYQELGLSSGRCRQLSAAVKQRLKPNATGGARKGADKNEGTSVSPLALATLFLRQRYSLERANSSRADADGEVDDERREYALRYYDEGFYRRRPGVWAEASVEDVRLEITSFLQEVAPDRTEAKQIGDVLVNVKALCSVSVDGTPPLPFHIKDPKRRMLALKNGLIDLTALAAGKPAKLLPHDPDWFSTSSLPYSFDANARCPKFKAFLGQIFNADIKSLKPKTKGDKRVKVFQEMAGYIFLPDNRFQKFFVLPGKGWNGKGTVAHLIQHTVGGENTASVTLESLGNEFGTESLIGKLVNISGDMNEIDNAKEGTLKTWTGEDHTTVYRKYKPPLEIEPTLKFLFLTNSLPWFRDKTNGIWRRLIVIPFTFALLSDDEADPQLRQKLREELPGILNWALRGLHRLLKQGRFTHCSVCQAAATKHRDECSPVRQFILDHFSFAAEYTGPLTYVKWTTTAHEVMRLVKGHAEDYGAKGLIGHIVCRELATMPGVSTVRPTTVRERTDSGTVFHGVCVGDPKPFAPVDAGNAGDNGAPKPRPTPTVDTHRVVGDVNGRPISRNAAQDKKCRKKVKRGA